MSTNSVVNKEREWPGVTCATRPNEMDLAITRAPSIRHNYSKISSATVRRTVAAMRWLALPMFYMMCLPSSAQMLFPTRPITVVVPFAAGVFFPDVIMRIVAERVSNKLGQRMIIENKPSAGGVVAGNAVARALPDGYTLLAATSSFWGLTPILFKDLGFDISTSFAPVAQLVTVDQFLVSSTSIPHNDVASVVRYVRERPGTVNFGSPGNGSQGHLLGAALATLNYLKITIIPYRNGTEIVQAFQRGEIGLSFSAVDSIQTMLEAGTGRPIAIARASRSPVLPDIPTFAESGLPSIEMSSYLGLLAPSGTPAEIIERLNTAIVAVLNEPEVRARFSGTSAEIAPGSSRQLMEQIKRDIDISTAAAIMAKVGER